MISDKLQSVIRHIDNFPKPGVGFKDLTPVLKQASLCREIVDAIVEQFKDKDIHAVFGVESRGFFLGSAIAMALNVPFIPVRKKGKLPFHTIEQSYDLEYGSDCLEIHIDAIGAGERVLIHDDVLATGGTAAAVAELVGKAGGQVAGFAFIIELDFLAGREKLSKFNIVSLTNYN